MNLVPLKLRTHTHTHTHTRARARARARDLSRSVHKIIVYAHCIKNQFFVVISNKKKCK